MLKVDGCDAVIQYSCSVPDSKIRVEDRHLKYFLETVHSTVVYCKFEKIYGGNSFFPHDSQYFESLSLTVVTMNAC